MDAHIWMGSLEVKAQRYAERLSPYDGRIVSRAAICSAADAQQALMIAQQCGQDCQKKSFASTLFMAYWMLLQNSKNSEKNLQKSFVMK